MSSSSSLENTTGCRTRRTGGVALRLPGRLLGGERTRDGPGCGEPGADFASGRRSPVGSVLRPSLPDAVTGLEECRGAPEAGGVAWRGAGPGGSPGIAAWWYPLGDLLLLRVRRL